MKQTLWCDACERNEPIDEQSALKWRLVWHGSESLLLKIQVAPRMEELMTWDWSKRACGDAGVLTLTSRWLSTGSLDPLRGAVADPPKAKAEV